MIEDGTAVGSALATAVGRLESSEAKSKIVILLTDGQSNAGKVPPMTAAESAKALGYRVYTIGAGTRGTAPYPQVDPFGRKVYVSMPVDVDEETLQHIAEATGGRYFRATDTATLRQIYDEIDKLETTSQEGLQYLDYDEIYVWLPFWRGCSCSSARRCWRRRGCGCFHDRDREKAKGRTAKSKGKMCGRGLSMFAFRLLPFCLLRVFGGVGSG